MITPYVCATCRVRILLPRFRARIPPTRSISYAPRQDQQRVGHHNPTELPRRDKATLSDEVPRGRYSGRELNPQKLLAQLNGQQQSRTSNNGNASIIPRQPRDPAPLSPVSTSRSMRDIAEQFVVHVRQGDCKSAVVALRELAAECGPKSAPAVRAFLRSHPLHIELDQLSLKVQEQWVRFIMTGEEFPVLDPAELFHLGRSLRIETTTFWRPSLWIVASTLWESPPESPRFEESLLGLVEMWRVCLSFASSPQSSPSRGLQAIPDPSNWDFLPPLDSLVANRTNGPPEAVFEQRLSLLLPVPKVQENPLGDDFASAALLTLDLLGPTPDTLSRIKQRSLANMPQCATLVKLLTRLLHASPPSRVPFVLSQKIHKGDLISRWYMTMVRKMGLGDLHPAVDKSLPPKSSSDQMTVDVAEEDAKVSLEVNAISEPSTDQDFEINAANAKLAQFAIMNIQRLGRALAKQDMLFAEKIKRETFAFAGSQEEKVPLPLYEHLMLTFLSLRNAKAAMEVWEHLQNAGHTPTAKTYTVVMRGCQNMRNASASEAFWTKMRGAGIQPDAHTWSVRVHSLMYLGQVSRGLQALTEMGREWLEAARASATQHLTSKQKKQFVMNAELASNLMARHPGPVDGVPRPNLVVMNSAISGLAASKDNEIPKVLTWGRTFGIEPDVVTYNALLNITMRHSQPNEAMKILNNMRQKGVQANSTTWTVLLTALFQGGFLDNANPQEQQDKIISFIDSLKKDSNNNSSGLDSKGYAIIIDRLLKVHNNPAAANAVLEHMTAGGLRPTSHIYTILMTSYFQKKPQPDLEAVEALWRQIQAEENGWGAKVDSVFFDRMIEGYATHHQMAGIQPALGFLRYARQAGQRPSWVALEMVARALAGRQEWTRLRALVDDVRATLKDSRVQMMRAGQQNFWNLVIQTGILRDEGIVSAEQLLPAPPGPNPIYSAAG